MATITAPVSHTGTYGTLGEAYSYLGSAVDFELSEMLDTQAAGLVVPAGDVAGSGSTTIRKRIVGGVGSARRMTAMSTETELITPSGFTTGYDDLAIGRYGLADEETFTRAITANDPVLLDAIAGGYAESYVSTVRYLMCVLGATFATDLGPGGSAADLTDLAALIAGFEETEGASGVINFVIHPNVLTDFRAAWSNYTGAPPPAPADGVQRFLGSDGMQYVGDWWGARVFKCFDVTISGGQKKNFAFMTGAIGIGVGSTARVPVMAGNLVTRVPERGLIITGSTVGEAATNKRAANAYFGLGKRAATVAPQFLFSAT